MKTKTIRQTISFNATPKEVYELIMDKKKHAAFTQGDVTMSRKIKGTFLVFGGYCTGYNIELIDGAKIVQAWRFDEAGWPDDHYSICHFLFEKKSAGTKLTFIQTGVPEANVENLKKGWHEFYWGPMKKWIAANT